MSRNSRSRLRRVALFSALIVLAQAPAAFAAETFGFENSLQGWTRDHFIDCEQDPEPCDFNWRITRSTEQALDGDRSLKMFLDGTNDDGTIWLERRFDVEPNSTTEVTIRFWLWSEGESDFNTWPVVAYAGRANPETEEDFTIVGQTDRRAGWTRYKLVQQVNAGPGGRVWVAFGFGATWETPRTHYIDSVAVAFN
jgi:hypothetical protein